VRPRDTRDHFAKLAPSYDALRSSGVGVNPITEVLAREADLRQRRVLDVGCGTGDLLRELTSRYGVHGVGIDRSPEMIREARRLLRDSAELYVGAAESIPLDDQSVERALMTMVVHLLDRSLAFREVHRVLGPQGRLAVASTDPEAVGTFWIAPWFPSYLDIESNRFPSAQQLEIDFRDAGFRALKVVPFAVPRVFDRETALAKLRGRAYSTFAFMSEEEFKEGVARAERELPPVIDYTLRMQITIGVSS
jgi:ubiquinone/menaquinone biosynthesis C-methylase UbiE